MYDMLISEEERDSTWQERPKRYKWPVIGNTPLVCQIMGGWTHYDVTWQWGTVFKLIIYRASGHVVFSADIPNWEMAEIEDVADSLIKAMENLPD
jgi:hypothetical protein